MQQRSATAHFSTAHPTGQDGFPGSGRALLDLFGNLGRGCHRLRGQDDQQTIGIGIACRDIQCLGIAFWTSVSQHIDWVPVTPMSREKLIEISTGLR